MKLSNQIVIATSNRGKFEEFEVLFSKYPELSLLNAADLVTNIDKLGLVEKHDIYMDNAIEKARFVSKACHYPVLADDSGLEVDLLGGRPGVRSARFAPPTPGKTQDQANIDYLLSQLKSDSPTTARFVCNLALLVEGIVIQSAGVLEGELSYPPRGNNGFGYDPIFVPKGSTKTLAEMSDAEKNSISHRARAVHELMEQVRNLSIVLARP